MIQLPSRVVRSVRVNVSRDTNKKALSLLLMLVLLLSYGDSTATKYYGLSESQSTIPETPSIVSEGLEHYTDESLTGYVEEWSDNTTSSGVSMSGNIIGEPDGLVLTMEFIDTAEFALLKINGSIMSDELILRNCLDPAGSDNILNVYTWLDPYTEPSLVGVPEDVPHESWSNLGARFTTNGDVFLEYDNTSIEYILLVGLTSPSGLGAIMSFDAIEVHGYTNIMADEQNDGIPDIWQYTDVEMHNVSVDVDLFGYTWGITGFIGTAAEGSTNLDFLTPFIKLGMIDPEDVDETHFYVICQCELKLPWSGSDDESLEMPYMDFLGSYDLLNITFINDNYTISQQFWDSLDRYIADDGRIRTYHIADYTVDGTFDPHNYYGAQGQINAEYNMLDVKTSTPTTAKEEFDLDISIVLDIMENVMDAVQGGKDMVAQFMKKIIGFIQGKLLDGIGKELLKKITKKAIKTALKAVMSITTIKDIIVKGSKILEKFGVTLPDWLRKARDFVDSIPFIDPPVEIWRVRLTFVDESTDLPILGYDYINNVTIDSHPEGIYFGDTYNAQVILSSRDIFPVVERIQSVNGSRTLTGYLYVEDLGTFEADMAKSSLEPGDVARGRVYGVPPNGTLLISQCHISPASSLPSTVELGVHFNVSLAVHDENGTTLNDIALARAAINNLPGSMAELPLVAEADGTLTLMVETENLGVALGDHMIAAIYKPANMFHDYWNFTFVLADTVVPAFDNVTAVVSSDGATITFSAIVTDYDLNPNSVNLETIDGSTDLGLATTHQMTSNGSHFVAALSASSFTASRIYFRVVAADNSGNTAQSTLESIARGTPSELGPLVIFVAVGVGAVVVVVVIVYLVKRPGK